MSLTSYQTAPPRGNIIVIILINIDFYKLWLRNIFKIFTYKNLQYKPLSPGNFCKGVTPDPIPNSAVKPFSANGTLS